MRHPSGPNLIGHPKCGKGRIFDHDLGRCISHVAYTKKYGTNSENASKQAKQTRQV